MNYTEEQIEEIKEDILEALETVIDPELGIDIVNLGLVYKIELNEEGHLYIEMTLTTVGCPLADVLIQGVKDAMTEVDEVKTVEVELVWSPAWTTDRMSRYARIALGVH
ncbi:metal-sulfur cluster assembly factor [Catellicoccus marimammalium]|uniref:Putative aromatic ring hydroxylating enzyme n=1 Tax=Catellicoccus marimammalium M35/04/3 TaxID=1234409 RepID=K8Z9C2_9ENTE|nr:metal-sulfur cluster assembly factor [Catellicoccus marimammalium]EKU27465.1 putative aromatic ring hydroxylating enzyme [Catellicoccus marimammalium M35/04/3]